MHRKRKVLLIIVLAVAIAAHIALFAVGGNWRTMGMILIAVDVVSVLFVLGAVREFRKLDEKKDSS
jgi:hypothetical protein